MGLTQQSYDSFTANIHQSHYADYVLYAVEFVTRLRPHVLHAFLDQSFTSRKKEDGSTLTQRDIDIERNFRNTVMQNFPTHGIIGEEENAYNTSSPYQWIIDPIDRTRDFARGLTDRGTLIALMHNGHIVLGVSSMPAMGELLIAANDTHTRHFSHHTSYQTPSIAHVSTRPKNEMYLTHARAKYFSPDPKRMRPDLTEPFKQLLDTSRYTKNGSLYNLHCVATGRVEAYVSPYSQLYDNAPFVPIITQAGGRVTTFCGNELSADDTSTIASSNHDGIHEYIVHTLAPHIPQ